MRRIAASVACLLAVANAASEAGGRVAAAPPLTENPDAIAYAEARGVALEEAGRRIELQPAIGALNKLLESEHPAALGGLYIDHEPYRVVVLATKPAVVKRVIDREGADIAVDFVIREVRYSLERLREQQSAIATELADIGVLVDLNVQSNQVVLEVPRGRRVPSARLAPFVERDDVSIVMDAEPRVPVVTLRGGLHLTTCTSGWTIYYGSNTSNRGITTAGHCPNSQSYSGDSLTYQGDQHQSGNYDVQSHKLSGASYTPQFQAKAGTYRTVTSKRYWSAQNVGDWVCHYGKTTGYGCGYIVSKESPGCVDPPPVTGT